MSIYGTLNRDASAFGRSVVIIPVETGKKLFADDKQKNADQDRNDPREFRKLSAVAKVIESKLGNHNHGREIAVSPFAWQDGGVQP
ncbi:hypothetical protein rosmuc_01794 [Roseovarius mucosus DSM 17069]|uniref:Uncharacterized protein n=1 Tax=Roseovarius mucosus DSM 17069 TaxID=1288298 RepID=A0A0A0HLN0_9RHOB|nr:hypothetical protein rosmuc_01794 [Roseovarius mucosus DSM 17069]